MSDRRGKKGAGQISRKRLPPGKYLVKIYIDETGKLRKDLRAELGENEYVGHVEFNSRWPFGYGRMTVVRFPKR